MELRWLGWCPFRCRLEGAWSPFLVWVCLVLGLGIGKCFVEDGTTGFVLSLVRLLTGK